MSDFSLIFVLQIKTSKIINDTAKVQQKSEKITAFGGIFFVLDKFDSIPAYYSHGSKVLPIHRGFAPDGRPLWNQGHRQGQEFPVQIHSCACQVGQDGKTV